MPLVFSPPIPPQIGASGAKKYSVVATRFGDGYTQRSGLGINDNEQTWPLTWKGTSTEIVPIKEFFDARKGYESFYWTPPLGVQGLYVVGEIGMVPEGADNFTLNCTFVESFQP